MGDRALIQLHTRDDTYNTSFGVWNQTRKLTSEDSHGDAGVFLVDIKRPEWVVACGGGYGLRDSVGLIVVELAIEQVHS